MKCERCGNELMENTKFCPNCGNQIPSGAKFCPKCGCRVGAGMAGQSGALPQGDMEPKSKRRKKRKKCEKILWLILILLLVLLAVGLYFGIPAASAQIIYRQQLSLGERYLAELDYESAIAAFNKAIEIAPKKEQAYRNLAQVYLDMWDYEKAISVLQKAEEVQVISEELENLKAEAKRMQEEEQRRLEEEQRKHEEKEAAQAVEKIADDNVGTEETIVSIPADAAVYQGHSYKIFSEIVDTWDDAQEFCSNMGGHLATASSEGENEFLFSMMKQSGFENAYFGLTDQDEEGAWRWCNWERMLYTNWHEGEPNSENSREDYAMFYYKYEDGSWNDGDFGGRTVNGGKNFICEWDTASEGAQESDLIGNEATERQEYLDAVSGDVTLSGYLRSVSFQHPNNGSTWYADILELDNPIAQVLITDEMGNQVLMENIEDVQLNWGDTIDGGANYIDQKIRVTGKACGSPSTAYYIRDITVFVEKWEPVEE